MMKHDTVRIAAFTTIAVIVITVLICVVVVFTFDPYVIQRTDSSISISIADGFILAIAEGNEANAYSYLSTNAKKAVRDICQDGEVLKCPNIADRPEWGAFNISFFEFGYKNRNAFSTLWDNENILMVIEMTKEYGWWKVAGWRGMITGEDGWPDGLIEGTNHLNQFPPQD